MMVFSDVNTIRELASFKLIAVGNGMLAGFVMMKYPIIISFGIFPINSFFI